MKKFSRYDRVRLFDLLFIEDCRTLNESISHKDYHTCISKNGLLEYINPSLSYSYIKIDHGSKGILFSIDKYETDPLMVVTLKKMNAYYVLDFYFPERNNKAFDKNYGLRGGNYLDTVCKIYKDEILPYIEEKDILLYFNAYDQDSAGDVRKTIFEKIVNKFTDKTKFDISINNGEFLIKPINK
jgi:hypothetical protein